jgi:hypothetical protein
MASPPHILFIPRAGPIGMGESIRALVLARAAARRWPGARIELVAPMAGSWLEGRGFPHHLVEGGASRNAAGVEAVLRRAEADLVVFDGWGRPSTLALARSLGGATVFIAANDRAQRRLFGSRRIRHTDEVWIVQSRLGLARPLLTRRQRLRLALRRRPRLRTFEAMFPEPDPARRAALSEKLGLPEAPYALLCAGGGGTEVDGRPVPEIFLEAAGRVHDETGVASIAVLGPLYEGRAEAPPGVIRVASLEPDELIDLLAGAEVVACGGGDLIAQAVANGRACVAADAGGVDQGARVRAYAEAGLIEASVLAPDAIADRVAGLLRDVPRREALRRRAVESGLGNRVREAVDAMAGLLARAGDA